MLTVPQPSMLTVAPALHAHCGPALAMEHATSRLQLPCPLQVLALIRPRPCPDQIKSCLLFGLARNSATDAVVYLGPHTCSCPNPDPNPHTCSCPDPDPSPHTCSCPNPDPTPPASLSLVILYFALNHAVLPDLSPALSPMPTLWCTSAPCQPCGAPQPHLVVYLGEWPLVNPLRLCIAPHPSKQC